MDNVNKNMLLKTNNKINDTDVKKSSIIDNCKESLFIQKGLLISLDDDSPLFICRQISYCNFIFLDTPYFNISLPGTYKIQLIINIPQEVSLDTKIYIICNNKAIEGGDINISKKQTLESQCYCMNTIFKTDTKSSLSINSLKQININAKKADETLISVLIQKC